MGQAISAYITIDAGGFRLNLRMTMHPGGKRRV